LKTTRNKMFNDSITAEGEYTVTSEFILFLRNLLTNKSWLPAIKAMLNELLNSEDIAD
jgi:hypothetical protein